jgi:hypothetical protein
MSFDALYRDAGSSKLKSAARGATHAQPAPLLTTASQARRAPRVRPVRPFALSPTRPFRLALRPDLQLK